jgi:hypothetical protein
VSSIGGPGKPSWRMNSRSSVDLARNVMTFVVVELVGAASMM